MLRKDASHHKPVLPTRRRRRRHFNSKIDYNQRYCDKNQLNAKLNKDYLHSNQSNVFKNINLTEKTNHGNQNKEVLPESQSAISHSKLSVESDTMLVGLMASWDGFDLKNNCTSIWHSTDSFILTFLASVGIIIRCLCIRPTRRKQPYGHYCWPSRNNYRDVLVGTISSDALFRHIFLLFNFYVNILVIHLPHKHFFWTFSLAEMSDVVLTAQ